MHLFVSQFWTFNSQAESAFLQGKGWSSSDICMLPRPSEMDVSIPKAKDRHNHHTNEDRRSSKGLSYFNDIDLWCFPRQHSHSPRTSSISLLGMESYKRKGKSHLRLKTKYQSLDFSTRNYMYKVKISHATPYITDPYLTTWPGAEKRLPAPCQGCAAQSWHHETTGVAHSC